MTIQAQFPDEQSFEGAFTRQPDVFRDWVTVNGSSGYPAARAVTISMSPGPVHGRIERSSYGNSRNSKTSSA